MNIFNLQVMPPPVNGMWSLYQDLSAEEAESRYVQLEKKARDNFKVREDWNYYLKCSSKRRIRRGGLRSEVSKHGRRARVFNTQRLEIDFGLGF
jgi:hypothetical protein